MYRYKVDVTRIVDGDTVDVDIDLGFGMTYKKQRVRLMGIDTPESRTRDLEEKFYGKQSKAFLTSLIEKADEIQLVSHDKGKFGRMHFPGRPRYSHVKGKRGFFAQEGESTLPHAALMVG